MFPKSRTNFVMFPQAHDASTTFSGSLSFLHDQDSFEFSDAAGLVSLHAHASMLPGFRMRPNLFYDIDLAPMMLLV